MYFHSKKFLPPPTLLKSRKSPCYPLDCSGQTDWLYLVKSRETHLW